MSNKEENLRDDLRKSLAIAEDVLCKRFPTLKALWDTNRVKVITEVGLVIFKELRKQGEYNEN